MTHRQHDMKINLTDKSLVDKTENVTIEMPDAMFSDMKEWVVLGKFKSVLHQEYAYSYYWLLVYLWTHTLYAQKKIGQPEIKSALGYNPIEKRINYIMKKGGLLNSEGYCLATTNYPIAGRVDTNEEINFDMLHDSNEETRRHLPSNSSNNFFVQSPLKHIGEPKAKGIFWDNSDTHLIESRVFKICMDDNSLRCAGFYMYGLLTHINSSDRYPAISNDLLCEMSGWQTDRIIRVKSRLVEVGLINGLLSANASKGEKRVFDFLSKNNLKFAPEYAFEDLKGIGESYLRFDFAVFDENRNIKLLIEYDGEHHFYPVDFMGLGENWSNPYFNQTTTHDASKDEYCKQNNFPFLRIPYWDFNNVEAILRTVLATLNLLERSVLSVPQFKESLEKS